MNEDSVRFDFGKNWLEFTKKNFGEFQVNASKKRITEFMKMDSLDGLSFLDIGCGSGLHSCAALSLGAKEVFSFDYDPISIESTKYIANLVGAPSNWHLEQGSVLDEEYMAGLAQFDIVYSWGVLHHTGNVWKALELASKKVKSGGLFYIALYAADVQLNPPPQFWLDVKKKYVSSSWLTRTFMDWWYVWRFVMGKDLRRVPEFLQRRRDHKKTRGMDIMTDIRDWLGGWPMEFVYDNDVIDFCKKHSFRLENITTGEACTEFLFVKEEKAS